MRTFVWSVLFVSGWLAATPAIVRAQQAEPENTTRQDVIQQAQETKLGVLHKFMPAKSERILNKVDTLVTYGPRGWHPFFQNAYTGGGFAVGAGFLKYVSAYNTLDVRGSYSITGYKLAEAEFDAPHLFDRRGTLAILGGWREATQVAFYGTGMQTSSDDRANFGFRQPYGSASLTVLPWRRGLLLRGGTDVARWSLRQGSGTFPSVDSVYTPETLTGLGTDTTYIHSRVTAAFDWRTASGYSRRGGVYAVTAHDFTDRDDAFGFRQVDYEVTQNIPILRETWVVTLHGRAQTTYTKSDQEVPFYLLPSLGGGSTLRAFSSWRFRDRNSLLLQAEWRIMANRFLDTAVFYDAGKVTARREDLDLHDLKSDVGFGVRFHTPLVSAFRIEVARGNEGVHLIFAAAQVF